MYFDSCLSFSRYCCSSDWLELAGLMTEFGFPGKKTRLHVTGMIKDTAEQHSHISESRPEMWHCQSVAHVKYPNPQLNAFHSLSTCPIL